MSKGEQKIYSILARAGVSFKQEVEFKGLYGAKNVPLRFDFVVYNQYGQVAVCLEYDGRQHFDFTPYFHKSRIDFRRQLEYDMRKNKFCLSHNIPLIRIPYWDIDNITFKEIFTNPLYRVKNKEHNIKLMEVKKNGRGT